tara:strand:- start:253 stop:582 length:330 start_codon:yes stop_codon:yes gene_type:complete
MKSLILLISLLFLNPNPKMEGVWESQDNNNTILIVYTHEDNIQFYNYKMDKEFHLNETVVNMDSTNVYTIYNDFLLEEEYKFYYILKNKNTLIRGSEVNDTQTVFKRLK